METNGFVISVVGVCVILLILFLIRRNKKEEKDFEASLNHEEHIIRKDKADVNGDE